VGRPHFPGRSGAAGEDRVATGTNSYCPAVERATLAGNKFLRYEMMTTRGSRLHQSSSAVGRHRLTLTAIRPSDVGHGMQGLPAPRVAVSAEPAQLHEGCRRQKVQDNLLAGPRRLPLRNRISTNVGSPLRTPTSTCSASAQHWYCCHPPGRGCAAQTDRIAIVTAKAGTRVSAPQHSELMMKDNISRAVTSREEDPSL
jgi:hypothetical protein